MNRLMTATNALLLVALGLAARGESLAAFDGRCILADCVALPLHIPDILGHPPPQRAGKRASGTPAWAALLVAYIVPLCALLAPCQPGASTPRMTHLFPDGP